MALLNFLYKNENILNSLTAQIFHGKTIKIDTEKKSVDTSNCGMKVDLKLLSGSIGASKGGEERFVETIDPHDEAILNTLTYLQQYCVDEKEIDEKKLVFLSGKIAFVSIDYRRVIMDIAFEQIKKSNVIKLPGKQANQLYSLAKNTCIGSEEESYFYFKSSNNIWYWGSAIEKMISPFVNSLRISNGGNLIPVILFAVCTGRYEESANYDENSLMIVRSTQKTACQATRLICGDIKISHTLLPLAIMQSIDAEPLNQDVEAPGE